MPVVLATTILLLLASSQAWAEWHDESGPWVLPTEGEVWPLPNQRRLYREFYLLRPSNFQILPIAETCDIVTEAIQRYTEIIWREGQIARKGSKGRPRRALQEDPFYVGTLSSLHVRTTQACTNDEEYWPHLRMNESYTLEIKRSSEWAELRAESVWGILRGLETFSQLLTPSSDGLNLKVRCQTIVDWPKLPHRGLLLDTSRHYLPLSDIFLTLDAMSCNKLNVLHWHIVDDNSFPYQSASYPELSAKGAYHPSMIYTASDIAEILRYARLRGIRLLPEFDTPGHTKSWGLSHPQLLTTCYDANGRPNGRLGPMNPINEDLYHLLRNLFAEIVQLFPDKYVHLGGDEVPFDCWASNPQITSYLRAHNITGQFAKLEGQYIGKLLNITTSLGAEAIVWQEVFDNGVVLPRDTVVHVWTGEWRGELESIIEQGHPALLSACWYLDHLANGGDWRKFYQCDPLGFKRSAEKAELMLGGEACMWGEFVDRNNVHSRIWPRASATAERLWSEHVQDTENVSRRLEEHSCRMNRRRIPAQPPNGPGFCVV